jgi:sirohydrochlorin ferrochelatase
MHNLRVVSQQLRSCHHKQEVSVMDRQSRALLVVAHGSRREQSNDEVRLLTEAVRARAGDGFGQVACAFLELAEPSIPDGIEQCISTGAREVVVLPYFLSAGRHVVKDIPAEVAKKVAEHPDVAITIAPYLGAAEGIVELMLGLSAKGKASASTG